MGLHMTRAILHLLLRLGLLCGLLTAIWLYTVRQSPLPALSTLPDFAACDLPCWAGVVPLETPFGEVVKIITVNLPHRRLNFRAYNTQISFDSGSPPFFGMVYSDRGTVDAVRLEVSIPLWMLLDALGKPTCVRVSRIVTSFTDVMVLYWERSAHSLISIVLLDNPAEWSPGAPTDELLVTPFSNDCDLLNAPAWQGFARVWRYRVN